MIQSNHDKSANNDINKDNVKLKPEWKVADIKFLNLLSKQNIDSEEENLAI
jgi:hypothetical protein